MPLENRQGPSSTALAQRVSADCANDAAYAVLSLLTSPPPPPLYTLCTSVRTAYNVRMKAALPGAQVTATCHPLARPVVFGIPAPAR
ncbi:hypothetical protein [Melittangium boletus]|uniref:hypothetical protein n=1 Tax=Melittangium boletus TaxID=83453 RepID=UPI003DA67A03